jgi:hypothetical protein
MFVRTHSVMFTRIDVHTRKWVYLHAKMWLRHLQLWFQNAQEWFLHAECGVDTYECDYDPHESDYDIHTCQNHTLRVEITLVCDVYMHAVMNTRTSVIYERKVWFIYVECNFYMQSLIRTRRV